MPPNKSRSTTTRAKNVRKPSLSIVPADADAGSALPTPPVDAGPVEPTDTTSVPGPVALIPTQSLSIGASKNISALYPNAVPVPASEQRQKGVGGSDAAAILGIYPYRTRLDVWMEKVGHPMWTPAKQTPPMRWGTLLEPLLREEYARLEHVDVALSPGRIYHPNGIQFGAPDGFVLDAAEFPAGLWEGKVSDRWEDWEGGVPEYYLPQVQQYLAITGLPWVDVSVLLPGADFRTYRVEAQLDYQVELESEIMYFWHHYVVPDRPPGDAPIEIRYPAPVRQERLQVAKDSILDTLITETLAVRGRIKELVAEHDELVANIKPMIAEYDGADGEGYRLHYRASKPPVKVGWEQIATTLWNTLAMVRRFVPEEHVPDELRPHLNRDLWETLQGLYTVKGKATRPFNLADLKEKQ